MINKPTIHLPGMTKKISHPGMMGDETEEQSLNEKGDPTLRINSEEVVAAFGKKETTKP